MPKLDDAILEYVQKPGYKPVKEKVLAKRLKVSKGRLPEFRAAMERLLQSGRLHEVRDGLLRPSVAKGMVTGTIKRTVKGDGYLIPHDPRPDGRAADIYIAAQHLRDAHTGDEVVARVLPGRRRGQRTGQVEEILVRATTTFVGTYFEHEGDGYVQVDGKTFNDPVYVGDPGAKGAQPEDKVVIEMLRFPTLYQPAEGVLTKVLGPRGEPGVDTLSIIHEFGLPDEFPDDVLAEARIQAEQFDEADLGGRLDLTKEIIVTIDPKDARDFDDAISLDRTPDGHWHLGVHIADVAHFVQPGSKLDAEAQDRGTSVYLPQRVLPMLPEVISNGLASLQQGKVRYTKSVQIEFSPEGVPLHTRFANSAIKVTRRFAYEEVMPIVREPDRFQARISAKVRALLGRMYELAMVLRVRRFAATALELNIGEIKIDFDEQGRVVGAHTVEHDESHQIIEEFMLAANFAVAEALSDKSVPFMRRTHGDPDEMKLRAFAEFASVLGFPLKRFQSRSDLQALLVRVRGEAVEHAVNYALLRSLKQAEYTGVEMGHYALAAENYCHFTSPIRRYPDLTVHRLIDQLVEKARRPRGPSEVDLIKLGKHCSVAERRAERAERELIKVKLLTYMAERVGEEMDAIITGVEPFGFFCQGTELPVEGLIHISALSVEDVFYYDSAAFSLIGRRSGRQYRLGDRVRVKVMHVDVDRPELDFGLIDAAPQRGPDRSADRPKRRALEATDGGRPLTDKKRGRKEKKSKRRKR